MPLPIALSRILPLDIQHEHTRVHYLQAQKDAFVPTIVQLTPIAYPSYPEFILNQFSRAKLQSLLSTCPREPYQPQFNEELRDHRHFNPVGIHVPQLLYRDQQFDRVVLMQTSEALCPYVLPSYESIHFSAEYHLRRQSDSVLSVYEAELYDYALQAFAYYYRVLQQHMHLVHAYLEANASTWRPPNFVGLFQLYRDHLIEVAHLLHNRSREDEAFLVQLYRETKRNQEISRKQLLNPHQRQKLPVFAPIHPPRPSDPNC